VAHAKARGLTARPLTYWLSRVAVLVASLTLMWGAGEIYYRFVADTTDAFSLSLVSRRWFDRHYQFNKQGVRDNVDYAKTLVPGRPRVSFLGDSFTAGHGIPNVEDRFANRIRRAHSDWDVHVLAENGFDTGREIEQFASFVNGGYETNTLALVYNLNDIADLMPEWKASLRRIYDSQNEEPFFVKHSYFINMLYYQWISIRNPDIGNYYSSIRKAYDSDLWAQQQERLQALRGYCELKHVKMVVVSFPFLHALGRDDPYASVYRQLAAFWNQIGVANLDLLATYQGHLPDELIISRRDPHPNLLAHALAADAIDRFLVMQSASK
jgi:hypothetical protein